jgi:hypothetical protein
VAMPSKRVVSHFLRHDPALGIRRVWTWLDWPGRLSAGIRATDLGEVKFRLDPRSRLRWEAVSTALGFRPDHWAPPRRTLTTGPS